MNKIAILSRMMFYSNMLVFPVLVAFLASLFLSLSLSFSLSLIRIRHFSLSLSLQCSIAAYS